MKDMKGRRKYTQCIMEKSSISFCPVHFRPVIHTPKSNLLLNAAESRGPPAAAISLTLSPAEPLSQHQGKKKGDTPKADESDTDPEAPVAQQMLSFVMDDPDFDSEASDTPKISKVKENS